MMDELARAIMEEERLTREFYARLQHAKKKNLKEQSGGRNDG